MSFYTSRNKAPTDPYGAIAYKSDNDVRAAQAAAFGQQAAAWQQAQGNVRSTLYEQPANFANAYAGLGASYGQNAANAFGAYSAGLGSLGNAYANERSNLYGANAMAEAARQGAASNVATSALGAFGGIGNSALSAWAQNQAAYKKAASDMHTANQMGMSQYGQSRNQALGQLASATGDMGGRLGSAAAAADIAAGLSGGFSGGGGGGSFSASGSSGPIASGSFGGGGGGDFYFSSTGRGGGSIDGIAAQGFGGLSDARQAMMSRDIPNDLNAWAAAGRNQLDAEHYTSRGMPSQMMGQALSGLMALGGQGYGAIGQGMDQFYKSQEAASNRFADDMSSRGGILDRLNGGFGDTRGDMRYGFDTSNNRIGTLWDQSLGNTPEFYTPLQQAQRAREAQLYNRRVKEEDTALARSQALSNLGTMEQYVQRAVNNADLLRRQLALSGAPIDPFYARYADPARAARDAALEWERQRSRFA